MSWGEMLLHNQENWFLVTTVFCELNHYQNEIFIPRILNCKILFSFKIQQKDKLLDTQLFSHNYVF